MRMNGLLRLPRGEAMIILHICLSPKVDGSFPQWIHTATCASPDPNPVIRRQISSINLLDEGR